MLNKDDKQKILNSIISKIGDYCCPICKSHSFTIADGYVATTLQPDTQSITIGSTFLPSVVLVCTNCGFTSLHNTKVLGVH